MLFNVCLDVKGRMDPQLDAWDRLLNRLERTLLAFEERELPRRRALVSKLPESYADPDRRNLEIRLNAYSPRAIIFADEGREHEITRALRKMSVFNPVPSRYGSWGVEGKTKNIPVARVIEDPVFKESHQSYFIQLADCIAYALLKREVLPTAHVKRYGIHQMFDECLAGICYRKAAQSDPLGIVRK